MVHGCLIAVPETFTVIFASAGRYMRMPILIAIVYVRGAMMIEVPTSAFNAVVKTLALNVAEFGWRRIPTAVIPVVVLVIARRWRTLRRSQRLG